MKFIQLCATLGWIEKAILITVSKSYFHFFGKRLKALKLARFEEVSDIIRALSGLPYIFDEECRHLLDPTVGKKPSALYVEYPASPFSKEFPCNWKPCPGYNPLDHQVEISGWEDVIGWVAKTSLRSCNRNFCSCFLEITFVLSNLCFF